MSRSVDQVAADETTALLSPGQQRAWFLHQLTPDYPDHVVAAWDLDGPLDAERLRRSLAALAQRHEPLRTSFASLGGRPLRLVAATLAPPLTVVELGAHSLAAQQAALAAQAVAVAQTPFALDQPPLWRVHLLRLGPTQHQLLLAAHRSIADEASLALALRDLAALYQADADPAALAPLRTPFAAAVLAQQRWLGTAEAQAARAFWQQQLAQVPVLALPTDYPRPPIARFRGLRVHQSVADHDHQQLMATAAAAGVAPRVVLLSAWLLLLARYSGQRDLTVGLPDAARGPGDVAATLGPLATTLVLRADLGGNPTVRTLLERVAQALQAAEAQAGLPFEAVVAAVAHERDLSHTTLFQVGFVARAAGELPRMGEVRVRRLALPAGPGRLDLTLEVQAEAVGLTLTLEGSQELFAPTRLGQILGHYTVLLGQLVDGLERRLAAVTLLSDAERAQLRTWGAGAAQAVPVTTLVALVEAQVARTPAAVAVVYAGTALRYGELNGRANQLAQALRARGVGPEARVGVCVERSLELVVALLAVLKAGAAYVPLDPSYPNERLQFMLSYAGVQVVITQSQLLAELPPHSAHTIVLDREWPEIGTLSAANMPSPATPDNLAYIIYTSGSTGRPKGVLVPHRQAAHSTLARSLYYRDSPRAFLLLSSLSFDSSVAGIYWTLTTGGALVLPSMVTQQHPFLLTELIEQERISHLLCVPSLYSLLLDGDTRALASLEVCIVAGETCPPQLVAEHDRLLPHAALFNEYGPTEAAVWSVVYRCGADDSSASPVPIGGPIANTQLYVLDRQLNLVPPGLPGELYIGGAGVVRGYLNRPALTAERFIPDPFAEAALATPGRRLYKTDDLVRYREDGAIEFLGRIDTQVKIRGYRIELGEIEAALREHPAVQDAAVVVQQRAAADQRLVAYVVPGIRHQASGIRGEGSTDALQANQESTDAERRNDETREQPLPPSSFRLHPSELRQFLAARMPDYMLPGAFVVLRALPRTPNGKIDRDALPSADTARSTWTRPAAPAATPLEQALLRYISAELGLAPTSPRDNFFDLGGHSLQIPPLLAHISARYQVQIELLSFFVQPTVEHLARLAQAAIDDRQQAQAAEQQLQALLEHLSDEQVDMLLNDPSIGQQIREAD